MKDRTFVNDKKQTKLLSIAEKQRRRERVFDCVQVQYICGLDDRRGGITCREHALRDATNHIVFSAVKIDTQNPNSSSIVPFLQFPRFFSV